MSQTDDKKQQPVQNPKPDKKALEQSIKSHEKAQTSNQTVKK